MQTVVQHFNNAGCAFSFTGAFPSSALIYGAFRIRSESESVEMNVLLTMDQGVFGIEPFFFAGELVYVE